MYLYPKQLDIGSCNNVIIDCYPSFNCSVICSGNNSCNNLIINSQNMVNLQCNSINNTCNKVKFNHNFVNNKKYLLPFIKIPNYLNITFDKIEIGEYYILAKSVSTPEILDDIKLTRMRCFGSGNSEYRQFGEKQKKYKNNKGHNVLYCDDCILESVYIFYKHLLWTMLEYKRQEIINKNGNELIYDNNNNNNNLRIQDMGYHYAWDKHIYNYINMEPRVIEYIIYDDMGYIGWHYDEDSIITMVIMISNHAMYDGGDTQIKFNDNNNNNNNNNNTFIEQFKLNWGDVVIFDSYSYHQILPILNGYRHVFVIEYWNIGRSFRNGRTSINNHLIDKQCIDNNGGWDCWYQQRDD